MVDLPGEAVGRPGAMQGPDGGFLFRWVRGSISFLAES